MSRKPSCLCGSCRKCKRREEARRRYERMSIEERRAWVARRDPEKIRARDRERAKDPERKAKKRAKTNAWRAEDRRRQRAHNAVYRALQRDVLSRGPCEHDTDDPCSGEHTVAHHADYDKPLEVRWFCHRHHAFHHRRDQRPPLRPPSLP